MSSDCYTCYKIEGDTRGLRRLVGIVARILRWRGSYLDYCKNRWRQDDLYDVNDDVEKIKEICRTILENDCVKAIEALPDGKSLWTFWAQTSRIPRPEMWQELAARYVPGARVYYFAENVYDAFALTNDRDKRWFRKDYLLYLDCSSEKRPEPELLTRLRQVLERPAYYREWPYDEYRCYISYWTVYEVQQLFRRLLGLPQTALVEARQSLQELARQTADSATFLFRYLPSKRPPREPEPCDRCQQAIDALDKENYRLWHLCDVLWLHIEQLRRKPRPSR